jgi:hypothetical protein
MFHLTRKKRIILTAIMITSLFLALSSFLPTINSQTAFTLPCTITTTGNAWEGYIAFDLEFSSNFMGTGTTGNYFVVMDTNGTVLALRYSDTSYGAAWNIAPETLMFLGEPQVDGADSAPTYEAHFWNLTTAATEDFPNVKSEHDIQYDPVNNTFLTLQQYVQPVGNNSYLIDKIVQLDSNGNEIWSWNPYDYLPLSEASPFNETSTLNGQTVMDLTHANTLDWDYNNSIIYLNLRNTNTFYKINQTTGDVVWACGEFGNFTLLDANGTPLVGPDGLPPSLWYHCHTVEEVTPDVFMLFNNDFENNTNQDDCRSSLMEITLNETSMTAYANWSWEAPAAYWNEYGGSILHLPNGDFFGDFGDPTHQFQYNELPNGTWAFDDSGAVFAEVNPAGQVVRTFTFPFGCYVYRVEPVTDPAFITFSPSTSVVSPTPTPGPIITPSPSHIVTSVPTPTSIPTPSPIVTPTPSPIITPTPSVSPKPAPSLSVSSQEIIASSIVVVVAVLAAFVYISKRVRDDKKVEEKKNA